MTKYIVNPVQVKMQEVQNGSLYQSIVAMGQRARQINDDIRYELNSRMRDILASSEITDEVNPDQTSTSKDFEKLPKPTFLAMRERFDGKLKFGNELGDIEILQLSLENEDVR